MLFHNHLVPAWGHVNLLCSRGMEYSLSPTDQRMERSKREALAFSGRKPTRSRRDRRRNLPMKFDELLVIILKVSEGATVVSTRIPLKLLTMVGGQ